jgi:hypothetical protein
MPVAFLLQRGTMIRCITCLPNIRGQAAPREFFFDEDSAAEVAAAELFVQREDRPGFGVFCCPNPLTERKRCRDTVAAIEWLWVDLDFKDVEEAPGDIDLYYDMLHCAPTRVIDSGHGRHIFWRLKEPLEPGDRWFDRACDLYKQLAEQLSGDPAPAHPAALMRRPGTCNSKDGTARQCRVLLDTGNVISLRRQAHG